MKSLKKLQLKWFAAVLVGCLIMGASAFGAHTYQVKITNLTKGQILSPTVVVVHKPAMTLLFELGEPASPELAAVAEDADLSGLLSVLAMDPNVMEYTTTQDPIMPGASTTVELTGSRFRSLTRISIVGMLVTTNDAFFAAHGVRVPVPYSFLGGNRVETYLSPAYDAGSEFNSELCASIPGPPCDNKFVRETEGAEGYVYIHPGIQGVGDLPADQFDWRNPVAKIEITAVPYF
jgi:hypothetical protein